MRTCIYSGSFDPLTYGHLDIINRAAKIFDKVIVAIGQNDAKKYTFTLDQRKQFILQSITHHSNVEVSAFNGLLADYAYQRNVDVVIKGVRNSQDFDYERLLHEINLTQQLGIDTFILNSAYNHISSTAAKEICKNQGLVDTYVPLHVKFNLEKTLNQQTIIGVTGEIGMGKSFVSHELTKNSVFHNIDLDLIAHDILSNRLEERYIDLRESIVKEFNLPYMDRKLLGNIVFNDSKALETLNAMMRNPILTRTRQEMLGRRSVIFLNGALLAEANFLTLCNNNVILVSSSKDDQRENLIRRGLTYDQIEKRIKSQYSTEEKKKKILESIKKENYGTLMEYANAKNKTPHPSNFPQFYSKFL